MTYARIENGVITEFLTPQPGFTLAECFAPAIVAACVSIDNVSPVPAVGWTAVETNGAWVFAAPAPVVQNFVIPAQQALTDSDRTVLRCYEHAVVVPADWAAYRAALRAIVAGETVTALPAIPAYPAGT
jgi:hypothetical protein